MSGFRVTHLDHCSVLITDVARSRHFYRDLLGLTEIAKPKTFDFVALWFDLGGGQTLHLLKKDKPDTRSPRHFALHVADLAAARATVGPTTCRWTKPRSSPVPTASSCTTRTATASRSSTGSNLTTRCGREPQR